MHDILYYYYYHISGHTFIQSVLMMAVTHTLHLIHHINIYQWWIKILTNI